MQELEAARQELDALKQAQADAERTQRMETLKTFAQNSGLDVEKEPVAGAISALDYEAVVAEAAKLAAEKPKTAAARPMSDIAIGDSYGGILSKTK